MSILRWQDMLCFGSIKPPFEDDHVNKEIQQSFDKIRGEASKKNVRLRTRVISTEASIVGAIVDYAELEGVELIVVGTRGKSGFKSKVRIYINSSQGNN